MDVVSQLEVIFLSWQKTFGNIRGHIDRHNQEDAYYSQLVSKGKGYVENLSLYRKVVTTGM